MRKDRRGEHRRAGRAPRERILGSVRHASERLVPRAAMKAVDLWQSRLLLRLQDNRGLRLVAVALSGCIFAFALHLAWLAFTSPLELEMREGSVWIHVLAKRAGVDIYDSTKVAFVNMNHGPLDPIFKAWISRCLPALPGHMVTRAFVLLGPVFLFGAAYRISRGHLATALLAAGALFLFFFHLSVLALVGRSDATAVCELAVCGLLAHELIVTSPQRWSNRSARLMQLGLGAASSVVFLTTSRYLPVAAALQLVVFVAQVADGNDQAAPLRSDRLRLAAVARNVLISAGLYLTGFAIVWVATLVFELHGELQSYYRHFFGFF